MKSKLKIAIQKKGRLNQDSLSLLRNCGITVDNGRDQLSVSVENFPVEILYLRNSDIPQYLEDGVVDVAIIGENTLKEKGKKVRIVEKLGFAKCRVSLAVPKESSVDDISFYDGKRIATSYPNTLDFYLKENNLSADIHTISGSVEIAPSIGLADAVCDIVSSGSTLFKNGLKEDEILFYSEAVLAQTFVLGDEKKRILDQLLFRIKSVLKARNKRYILMNVPNNKIDAITKLLPVLKSPTVLPLTEEGWSSMHSVIDKDKFWEVIDQLKSTGAQDILIAPIEKMVI